ncbi:Gfo/Idh/MocA family oxidoreductase [Paenarthrobacter sp. Z7-10]|uniref:Gfo/Idh/MocA family protein n=1 Tax=Paenarthrobacter sp. Z7-10 TaxID=2787635 RepID=UPI0022A8EC77|nr:Gfo/Idh/MocA family oxidoreductase [Paenarthrobacter sp. Z7-10]MCZ2402449.1 Gfo/Idh/MocA family oxidoreductase [Paenarthrobacter sp. Z7-10]
MSIPNKVRFALVGAGIIGNQHGTVMRELADELDLVAVVDLDRAKADKIAAQYGGTVYTSLPEALAGTDFDAVAVCTPTGAHAEVAIEALHSGKHVIIEKPAEVTLAKTDEIIAAQQQAGTLVTVISQHRFDPSTEIVLEAIRKGELGRLTSGIASIDWWRGQTYYDSGDWRGTWALDGGGALMNQGVHTVDLLVAALGNPVEVFAYTATLAHERIEVEDVAVGVVKFESGALGVLHGSTAAFPGLSARLQVHGDKGSAVIDNDKLTYIHTTPQGTESTEAFFGSSGPSNQLDQYDLGNDRAAAAGANPGQLSDAHRHQYLNFLAALRGDEEIRVGLAENRRSVSVILAAYESARTGQPVSLRQSGTAQPKDQTS